MNTVLLVLGCVFVGFAAVLHLVFFYFESIAWRTPAIWRLFGVKSQSEADTLAPMAYNQGYYNAFLAVGALVGILMLASTNLSEAGFAITAFCGLCMMLAAAVLVTSNRRMARAALLQGAAPLVGVACLLLSLLAG